MQRNLNDLANRGNICVNMDDKVKVKSENMGQRRERADASKSSQSHNNTLAASSTRVFIVVRYLLW